MKVTYDKTVEQYCPLEVTLQGKTDGNPFTDYTISGVLAGTNETVKVDGFYDGGDTFKVRFMPSYTGKYTFSIEGSFADEIVAGEFDVTAVQAGNHGPVRVAHTYHFAYADGTPYLPFGTTSYVWTHQSQAMQEQTLRTLKNSAFNKIRFCVLPKHYSYNLKDPVTFPYEGTPCDRTQLDDEGAIRNDELPGNHWDFARFNVAHFRNMEQRIADLMALGIEADIIVMHPYDCWGFCRMNREQDDLYWKYVVARFAAYRNVWWSLANEYDLLRDKTDADWTRYAEILIEKDPYNHLRSIHNCTTMYDYKRSWVTHCGIQTSDVHKTRDWREQFGKPVIIDEMCYEGDIDQGWGNITQQEMSHRCWEVAMRGGYIGHGETYVHPDDLLWWSHGGVLHGESEPRIAFLRRILEQVPGQCVKPKPMGWDIACVCPEDAASEEGYYLLYLGIRRPSFRRFHFDDAHNYRVEIIDTWNMTITDAGIFKGWFKIELPSRQYMALRITRV